MAVTVRLASRGGPQVGQGFRDVGRAGEEAFERIRRSGRPINPLLRGISAGVNDAEGRMRGFSGQVGAVGAALNAMGPAGVVAAVGLAGLTAGLAAAIEKGADFQQSLANQRAATGNTAAVTRELGDLARALGLQYGIGARAANDATTELVKAGVSTADALGGAVDAALLLSAATGDDVPKSAAVSVQAMQIFNKRADELRSVVNQAKGVLDTTKQSLDDYALALGAGGAAAAGAGVSLEDYNAALAATASAFTSGQTQGTSFKVFLQRLTPQSNEARQAMAALGFSAFDTSGNLKALDVVAGDLAQAVDGLTEEQRQGALNKIFGTEASTFALALLQAGAERVRSLRDEIIPLSDATAGASIRMDTLRGEQLRAKAAAEELGIAISERGPLVQGMTALTRATTGATLALAEFFGSKAFLQSDSTEALENRLARLRRELGQVQELRRAQIEEQLIPEIEGELARRAERERLQRLRSLATRPEVAGLAAQYAAQFPRAAAAPAADPLEAAAERERRGAEARERQAAAERERVEALRALEQALRAVETPLETYAREMEELAVLQQRFPDDAAKLGRAAQDNAADFLAASAEAGGLLDSLRELDGQARETALAAYAEAVRSFTGQLASGALGAEQAAAALARVAGELRAAGEASQRSGVIRESLAAVEDRYRTPRERDQGAVQEDLDAVFAAAADGQQVDEELLERIRRAQTAVTQEGIAWRDAMLEGAEGLVQGLVRGIAEGRKLKDIASDLAGSLLGFATSLAFSFIPGGGGAGAGVAGSASTIASVGASVLRGLGGGGRAIGGSTRAGFRYALAEDGRPELFMLGGRGQVFSGQQTAAMLAQMGGPGAAAAAQPQRLEIVLRDESNGRVQAREDRTGQAQRLTLLVRETVRDELARGNFDPVLRARYGIAPRAGG